jgi:hypothetical protein
MKKLLYFCLALLVSAIVSVSFVSCGSDDDDPGLSITPESVVMHYNDTKQLKSEGATSWLSNDEFVATVDQKGVVTGGHVGTTQIVASNGKKSASATITITPEYDLYDTPITDFGASKSVIKSKERHELSSEKDSYLSYTYSEGNHPCLVTYNFDQNKLSTILVALKYSDYITAGYYLIERYQPFGKTDELYVFINSNKTDKATMGVSLGTMTISGSKITAIMYTPYPLNSSSSPRRAGEIKYDLQILESFFQDK